MNRVRIALILFCLPALALAKTQNTPRATVPAPANGFRAEFLAGVDEVEEKLLDLAAIIPAEAYSWRPAPGVRSIGEVFMHIAGANYVQATFLGADLPRRADDLEKTVTKKADVIAELRRSFDHVRAVGGRVDDLDRPVKMFGTTTTRRGVMVTILNHAHEHLGQSIAYARMNGVAPPWSR